MSGLLSCLALLRRRATGLLANLTMAALVAGAPGAAHAQDPVTGPGSNTMAIMAATAQGFGSCLRYQVTGVCFFLECTLFYCQINTSIRVAHYVPDVVVSTYGDPAVHPWTDIGRPVSAALTTGGSSMMGMLLDSSAGTNRVATEVKTMKSADAIGNPVGAIMAGGGGFEFPSFNELSNFPSQELPNIMQQWSQVPVDLGNSLVESARAAAMSPGAMLNDVAALPGQFGSMLGSMGNMGSLGIASPAGGGGAGGTAGGGSSTGGNTAGNWQQQLDQIYTQLGSAGATGGNVAGSGSSGMSPYICPGDAGFFSIKYSAELDATFWRSKIPLELLYPGSWIPGVAEVGSGFTNTWGSLYPRIGTLIQQQHAKSSAVFAERVGSIIKKRAQPHIYSPITAKGEQNYVYFKRATDTIWQGVYPTPEADCIKFGTNDSLGLTSFGDGKITYTDGYIWNMWNLYECCERKPMIFLFAVP